MSDTYMSIIEGVEDIQNEILKMKDAGNVNVRKNYFVSMWIDDTSAQISFLHKEGGMKTLSLKEYIEEYCKNNIYELIKLPGLFQNANLKAKWIDEPFKNWKFISKMNLILDPLVKISGFFLNKTIDTDVLDGILNVFFRLTNFNNGAMVPIIDLIDVPTAYFMSERMRYIDRHGEKGSHTDFNALNHWNLAIQGFLFTFYNMNIKFPAPYYPSLGVLEKKDSLQQALIDLELSLIEYKGKI